MKTPRAIEPVRPEVAFYASLTEEQIAIRNDIIEQTRKILVAQHSGRIAESQKAYEYLQEWCDGKGVDFGNAYSGAIRFLRKTAVGLLDSHAYAGIPARNID